jgi:hypothetical protein
MTTAIFPDRPELCDVVFYRHYKEEQNDSQFGHQIDCLDATNKAEWLRMRTYEYACKYVANNHRLLHLTGHAKHYGGNKHDYGEIHDHKVIELVATTPIKS